MKMSILGKWYSQSQAAGMCGKSYEREYIHLMHTVYYSGKPKSTGSISSCKATTHYWCHVPNLHYTITSTCHHKSPWNIHGHMANVVFSFMKSCQRSAIFIFDRLKTRVTNPDLEFKAHYGIAGAFRAAFATYCLTTFPTVMLPQTQCLCIPHLLYIPEEGLLTLLTGITF